MVRGVVRVFLAFWLLAVLPAAALAAQQAAGALEITLNASEAPGAPAGGKIKLYSASKALVIGIDNYSAGWPRLSGAVEDAKAVAEALKRHGFQVSRRKGASRSKNCPTISPASPCATASWKARACRPRSPPCARSA